MTILCRLGMRIGALAHLRMATVIENYDRLCPGMERWSIRRHLLSYDKGDRLNAWQIDRFTSVIDALDAYVHNYWRPRYEKWHTENGKETLIMAWLFETTNHKNVQKSVRRNPTGLGCLVRKILLRVGIPSERAHAHAIRKGVCTELLRAGNPLKTVSLFLHHKNTAITERFYDKRKREEVLDGMVLPVEWESVVNDPRLQSVDGVGTGGNEEEDASSSMPTEQREAIINITGAFERAHNRRKRMKIMRSFMPPDAMERYRDACVQQGLLPDDDDDTAESST